MPELLTVLLASPRSGLPGAIAPALHDVAFVTLDDTPPAACEGSVLAFVEWLLPSISGLEMCRRLRACAATVDARITMVLDEDSDEARARALRAGADDYLLGPLTPAVLLARISRFRPEGDLPGSASRIVHGDLTVDLAAHQARWRGRLIALRPNELRLLALFAEHPDRLFSRANLIAMLGKDCAGIDARTVDVWVGRLRRALRTHSVPDMLRTVRSLGYVLDSLVVEPLSLAS